MGRNRGSQLRKNRKATTPTKLVNHVIFVLDCSGSMTSVSEHAMSNFNEQIQTLKNESYDQETRATLIKFSSKVTVVYKERPIKMVKEMTKYSCGGMTALYDAIGLGLEGLKEDRSLMNNKKRHAALVVIITDGYENASKEYNQVDIKKEIEKLEKCGNFTFTFLGADIDVWDEAVAKMSFSTGNTMSFDKSFKGMNDANFTMNTSISNYYSSRRSGLTSVNDFYSNSDD